MKIRGLLFILIIFSLNSCHLVEKYKSPEYNSNELFGSFITADTVSIAKIPWQEYFKDEYLQSLITEGLNNNFDLKIATERILQSEAALSTAKLAYFPSLGISGSGQFGRISVDKTNGDKNVLGVQNNQYSLGLASSWEVDIWGKLNKQQKSAKAQYLGSIESKYAIQTALISNIANTYYALLSLDAQLEVTNKMISLIEESNNIIELMMKSGLQTAAAVEQSKALLYGTKSSVFGLKYNIIKLENTLCLLTAKMPGTRIIRNKLENQIVPESMAYGLPLEMLANRPDVRAAELNFRSAFELTSVARSNFYPSLSLSSGFFGYGSTELKNFFKPENLLLTLIGNLTQPIFAKGQLRANLKVAKANQEIALLSFEQTVLSSGIDVCNILSQFELSLKTNESRSEQVEALKKTVDYTQKLLKGGLVNSYIEVINAQQSLLNAELNQVSDKLTQLQCTVDLYRALGGGVN